MESRFNIYGRKCEQRQNVCIFTFQIKTLQTVVSTNTPAVGGCVFFLSPLDSSYLAFPVSHCLDKKHLCRLGIVGAS